MGFKIGKKISRGFKKLGKGLKSITKVGGKLFSSITKTLGSLVRPFAGVLGGVLNLIPGGQLLTGLVGKFLGGPLGLQSPGVLGALGGALPSIGSPGGLAQFAQLASQTAAFQSPQGQANLLQLLAYHHARLL